jgi:hypothetical protein
MYNIRTRSTQRNTVLNVTHEGVDPRQAILTVPREVKAYSALNKGADIGSGRSRKSTQKTATKEVNGRKCTSIKGVTSGEGASVVEYVIEGRISLLSRCHADSPNRRDRPVCEKTTDGIMGGAPRRWSTNTGGGAVAKINLTLEPNSKEGHKCPLDRQQVGLG